MKLFPRHAVDARIAREFSPFELQSAPIGIEFTSAVHQAVDLDEQLPGLKTRCHERQRGKHEDHCEEEAEASHYRCLFLPRVAVLPTRPMALMKDAPWSSGKGVLVRSATRSTAERARTLSCASSSVGRMRPSELSMGCGMSFSRMGKRACAAAGLAAAAMHCLTMRSSREWKLITAKRPPGANTFRTASRASASSSSS